MLSIFFLIEDIVLRGKHLDTENVLCIMVLTQIAFNAVAFCDTIMHGKIENNHFTLYCDRCKLWRHCP